MCKEEVDFIVVGGGSGGSVVASRLSEVAHWQVALLEAGGPEPTENQVPAMYLNHHGPSNINWDFKLDPQTSACLGYKGACCHWPRGKVMGGTSVLHGMMYMRGHPWDYDRWMALGVDSWTFKDVLPYFIKSEDNRQIGTVAEPQYHGTGGYLTVQRFPDKPPLVDAILAGARELGCDTNLDLNGKRQLGFSVTQATVRNGVRLSLAKAFIHPILGRKNLRISLHSMVTKVIVDPITRRALGVQYRRRGETFTRTLIARKEVILCAGAIQSPQLLLLSGIGPASELLRVGVPVVYNLPRVGKNLMNHVSFTLNCWVSGETAYQRLNKKTLNQFLHTRSGPMASTGLSQLTGFVRLNLSDVNTPQSLPDIQVFFAGYMANDSSTGSLDEIECNGARYINIVPTLLRPRSRGELTLKSSDAMEPPSIKANYLQHQEDVDYLIEAIRSGRGSVGSGLDPLDPDARGLMLTAKGIVDLGEYLVPYESIMFLEQRYFHNYPGMGRHACGMDALKDNECILARGRTFLNIPGGEGVPLSMAGCCEDRGAGRFRYNVAPFSSPCVSLLTPSLVPFLPITEELFVKFCERLIQTESMRRKGVKLDTAPAAGCEHLPHGSRNYWECAIRHWTNPENHQVGTCAMGRSEMDSVLDSRLRSYHHPAVTLAKPSVEGLKLAKGAQQKP
ncbi:unnamed protein product, partial [Timema podura]|nr:unnamed protein product [Timema podura]